ncbi:hypothetical protein Kpho02_38610 [Kitasatospora phosalacinea]|uniref:Uncharacterized protein n=1 Tax=Kitasatospora phosalacinea TaxID=2065 RepID=A0A9W6QBJ0_9ACTN|nr:hypothetical protein Kpho02_38610 [Kitasatospora phosalacinea]
MALAVNGLDALRAPAGPERAATGPFGAPVAHGHPTLPLFIPLFTELLEAEGVTTKVNHGLNKVRFYA